MLAVQLIDKTKPEKPTAAVNTHVLVKVATDGRFTLSMTPEGMALKELLAAVKAQSTAAANAPRAPPQGPPVAASAASAAQGSPAPPAVPSPESKSSSSSSPAPTGRPN
jgi:hypothetical protein